MFNDFGHILPTKSYYEHLLFNTLEVGTFEPHISLSQHKVKLLELNANIFKSMIERYNV